MGAAIGYPLHLALATWGASIVLATALVLGLLTATGTSVREATTALVGGVAALAQQVRRLLEAVATAADGRDGRGAHARGAATGRRTRGAVPSPDVAVDGDGAAGHEAAAASEGEASSLDGGVAVLTDSPEEAEPSEDRRSAGGVRRGGRRVRLAVRR